MPKTIIEIQCSLLWKRKLFGINTVKASNFGPHGEYKPFFRLVCYHGNASYRKIKLVKLEKKKWINFWCTVLFCSCYVHNSAKEPMALSRICPEFSWTFTFYYEALRYMMCVCHPRTFVQNRVSLVVRRDESDDINRGASKSAGLLGFTAKAPMAAPLTHKSLRCCIASSFKCNNLVILSHPIHKHKPCNNINFERRLDWCSFLLFYYYSSPFIRSRGCQSPTRILSIIQSADNGF